ncbi:MAG: FHA domain-containing protein [Ktedonobacteraceae bacterium]|nr:FHA domain-containing protein [Ktedonobacteraceae bacterium]
MPAALQGPFGRVALDSPTFRLGRAPDNQLAVNDPKVSAHHAIIQLYGQSYSITDVGSSNGTFVNEQRLEKGVPQFLKQSDRIRIGDTVFTFEDTPEESVSSDVSPTIRRSEAYAPTMRAQFGSNPPGADVSQSDQPPSATLLQPGLSAESTSEPAGPFNQPNPPVTPPDIPYTPSSSSNPSFPPSSSFAPSYGAAPAYQDQPPAASGFPSHQAQRVEQDDQIAAAHGGESAAYSQPPVQPVQPYIVSPYNPAEGSSIPSTAYGMGQGQPPFVPAAYNAGQGQSPSSPAYGPVQYQPGQPGQPPGQSGQFAAAGQAPYQPYQQSWTGGVSYNASTIPGAPSMPGVSNPSLPGAPGAPGTYGQPLFVQQPAPTPQQKPNNTLKILIIALIAVVILGAGGWAILYFTTRPQPVIDVRSEYNVNQTPAGSTGTVFHITGQKFPGTAPITFLLDGKPAPGVQAVNSDKDGNFKADLTVRGDWALGDHTLTAQAPGDLLTKSYVTKTGVKLTVVAQGQAHTPGPNGAPPDDTSMTIKATVQFGGSSQPFDDRLIVTGKSEGGTVCQQEDDGQPHEGTTTSSDGTITKLTLTLTCSGSYKGGKLVYTETITNGKIEFSKNGRTVSCTLRTPLVNQHLEGTFSNKNSISGNAKDDAVTADCDNGVGTLSFRSASQGTWTGTVQ